MSIRNNFPSIRPSLLLDFANSKRLDPRVTFTRASTATYYDGVTTAKAEENLFLQSQAFDEAVWSKSDLTASINTTVAPDGTTTADTLTSSAVTSPQAIAGSVTTMAGVYTMSVHVKRNGTNFIQMVWASTLNSTDYANFDLVNGTITAGTYTAATITSLGNDWYRCTLTSILNAATSNPYPVWFIGSGAAGRASTYAGNGTDGVFVWGAQIEQRSAATAYTATTTAPITNYVPRLLTAPANVARFDHTPTTGASLGLLVEESRQNLALRSDDFANASWTKSRSSITSNTIIAPDGSLTGDKLVEDTTANDSHRIFQNITTTAAVHTISVYAKAGERGFLVLENSTAAYSAYFNLTAGTVGTVSGAGASATITAVGNGWYRCALIGTATAAAQTIRLYVANSGSTFLYTGDGYSGLYIWGAQLEAGAFLTSYIPTVASAVTRSADSASMTGTNFSSWFNNAEGTVYADFTKLGSIGFSLGLGFTGTNYLGMGWPSSAGVYLPPLVNPFGTVTTAGVAERRAVAFSSTGASQSLNAGTVATATAISVLPSGTNGVLYLGTSPFSPSTITTNYFRKVAFYPIRLTNAQLQAITG
jgi:hypothetical protein